MAKPKSITPDPTHLQHDPAPAIRGSGIEPLLKWPGGKRSLLKHLLPLVPTSFGRYFEPFVGGGALFFALQPSAATLSDCSDQLINCYRQVQNHPSEVIHHLKSMRNTEQDYYAIRSDIKDEPAAQAARLIYLVTLSFNGIYRENTCGMFNVPYGHKTHLDPCDSYKIHAASQALLCARLLTCDFEKAVASAQANDLVYLDPPYTVAHSGNGFVKYNARVFSWEDQRRLAALAKSLANKGVRVLVSNADHPSIEALYDGFNVQKVRRASTIAASGKHRGHVAECIFFNEP